MDGGAVLPEELAAGAGAEAGAAGADGVDSDFGAADVFVSGLPESDPESEEGSLLFAA